MDDSNRRTWTAATVAACAVAASLFGLAQPAAAHGDPPVVTALHAFVGDPLWGLGTPEGTLFGILPDERTAMASTTKVMTLHLAVEALKAGLVQLDDQVTINAYEASIEPPNSVMADTNGVTLEEGEVVSLKTLFRGMMYPSGNDAAWAVGRHVAQAYLGPAATDADFLPLMNQHAADEGLVDTQFTSANGWDDPSSVVTDPADYNHYTTARELSKLMAHAIVDTVFQQVTGFKGTYTDTTTGAPSGMKTYSFGWGFNYPGWEGAKGGGTTNCNGPNGGCMVMSAKRIGRRVVEATMQGLPWTEDPALFDYGFAKIFHPDPRGASVSAGAAADHDLTCLYDGRAVSAIVPDTGDVRLVSWQPNVDASTVAKLAEATLPKSAVPPNKGGGQGPAFDVAVAELPSGDLVVAFRKGASVELSRWSIAANGSLTLLASDVKAGPATSMGIQAVSGDTFLTAITDPDGVLVVKSWRLSGSSGIVHLDTYRDESRAFTQVAIAGPLNTDVYNGHRAATVSAVGGGIVHDVWGIDATGEITRLGELFEGIAKSNVTIAPVPVETVYTGELFPPVYYASATWNDGGNASIRFYRIDPSGTPVKEGQPPVVALKAYDVHLAPLGVAGVLTTARDDDGDDEVELRVYDAARQADNTIAPDLVAEHAAGTTYAADSCRLPSAHAEGDYVIASTDTPGGALRLRAYRSGDRP